MRWWFGRGKHVLTIGSVHLDTIALSRFAGEQQVGETEVGSIIHSVGGSAYNVAANLATHQSRSDGIGAVAIYSILPQHSVLTEIIAYKVNATGASSRFLRLYKDFNGNRVRGGGYVGLLDEDKRLIRRAVVDAAMHDASIFNHQEESAALGRALDWADILCLDADLAVATVNRIAQHARENEKPLFLSIGSALAGTRSWLRSDLANQADALGGRSTVIGAMLEELEMPAAEIEAFRSYVMSGDESRAFDVNEVCRQLRTRFLVCSNVRESRGFALLAAGETPYKCFFATPEIVRSRMQGGNSAGIVDGALAGFIQAYAQIVERSGLAAASCVLSDQTRKDIQGSILNFVEYVSESEGATPGSVISFEEQASEQGQLAKLRRLTRIAFEMLPVFRFIFSIAAFIIAYAIIEKSFELLAYFGVHVPLLEQGWVRMIMRK